MKIKYYLQIVLAMIVLASFCMFTPGNNKQQRRKSNKQAVNTVATNDTWDTSATSSHNTLKFKKNKTVPIVNQIIYNSSNTHEGIIGIFNKGLSNNPAYNVFHISVDKNISNNTEVWLEYELCGLQDFTSVCRSVNDQLSTGGFFVRKSEGWSRQSEQINPNILRLGLNVVRFTVPENATYGYKVRNVCLRVKPTITNEVRKLTVNRPSSFTYFKKYGYLQGFVSGTGSEKAKLTVNGKPMSTNNGTFEGLTEKQDTGKGAWTATVIAEFEDGMQLKTDIEFNKQSDYDYANNFYTKILCTEQQIAPIGKINVLHKGLQLSGDTNSILTTTNLSVTTLRAIDMASMGTGMVNVTGEGKGFRLLPHQQFEKNLLIKIKYDTTYLPVGYRAEDIRTYYYDETANNWKVLPLDTIDKVNCMIVSYTNHFTDFINSIIKVPELPETQAYTPTSLKDVKVANPLQGLNLISPPGANNMGTANLSYPIEIPAGRQGMQPNLAVQYNSGGGNGWMGMGWDLSIPAITVETRWGVPRYSTSQETESYLLSGEEMKPQIQRQAFVPRDTTSQEKQFYSRVEGAFNKIIRHGITPKDYWWSVTDRNGLTSYYGKYYRNNVVNPDVVLTDDAGNIAHWALAETVDLEGNSVRYFYDNVQNTGLQSNNSETQVVGKQIYISSIVYTDHVLPGHNSPEEIGIYSVVFKRDDGNRTDKLISCRYGFKEVTAHLLKYIYVEYNNDIIREYLLNYKEGAFNKSLLCSINEYTSGDGETSYSEIEKILYNTCDPSSELNTFYPGLKVHCLNYYDDISNLQYFTDPITVTGYDDQTSGSTVFKPDKAYASAISGTGSKGTNIGGALGFGLGYPFSKNMSLDGNYNHSSSYSKGEVTLVDIDGDGLPDKIVKNNSDGTIYYRRLLHDENGYHFDANNAIKLDGVHNFLSEHSSSHAWGYELHLGDGSASFNVSGEESSGNSMTSVYLADVNADGKIDIVDNGTVYFNQDKGDGSGDRIFKSTTSDTVYVGDGQCNFIVHSGEIIDSLSPPKKDFSHESVRLWVAPFTGDIVLYAPIQLIEDTSYSRRQARYVNGIRYAIQHSNNSSSTEICHDTISANNYTSKNKQNYEFIVNKGDRIYFRLQSENNRDYDNVYWDPIIKYHFDKQPTDTNQTDADRKGIYTYQASDDFLLTGKSCLGMPMSGSVRINGIIIAPAMSDTLHFQIYKNSTNLIKEVVFEDNTAINYYIDTIISVDSSDIFNFYARANTDINWSSIKYNLKLSYVLATYTIDTNAWDSISYKPLLEYSLYQNTIEHSKPITYLQSGSYTFNPVLYYQGTNNSGSIVFAIKTSHQLLAKKTLTIQNNSFVGGDPSITLNIPQDTIYYEFYADSSNYDGKITDANVSVTINNSPYNIEAGLHIAMNDTLWKFGPLYRGWGQFVYNPDSAHVLLIIDESKLTLSNHDPNALSNIDTVGLNNFTSLQNLAQAHNVDPLNDCFGMMFPDLDSNVWRGYNNLTMVGAEKMSNINGINNANDTVFDSPIPQVPIYGTNGEIIGYHNASAPIKSTNTESNSFNVSEGYSIINIGASSTSSTSELLTDFMDMNGDGYPDFVTSGYIQYSTPQGGLDNTMVYNINGINQNSSNSSGNTFGANYPQNNHGATNNTKISKLEVSGDGNLGISGINGNDNTPYTLMDINGDGLPDKVLSDGTVALNLGYKFALPEAWSAITRSGQSNCTSYSAGASLAVGWGVVTDAVADADSKKINLFQTSISAGIGISNSTNDNTAQMMDINGDGLLDRVTWVIDYGNSERIMKVSFNTGIGFIPDQVWDDKYASTSTADPKYAESSTTYNESANLAITFGFVIPIPFFPIKFIINPKGSINASFTKEKVQLIDINGDGYPDYVTSNLEGDMTVRYSTLGKLNLLKNVANPVGSSFDVNYTLSDNSVKSPHRNWELASVKVFDGHVGDGVDTSLTTFSYKDPYYERYERVNYGYDTVITSLWNTGADDPFVYRTITDAYHNDTYMFKGLKKYELLKDEDDNKYVETVYIWKAALIATGEIIPDNLMGCYENYYPVTTQEDKYFYEGAPDWSIHTQKQYIYGRWGNVVQYTDLGDVNDDADDLIANIRYDTIISLNLLSLQDSINVLHNGNTLRSRSASFDQNTGKVTEIVLNNTNSNSVYDFTYDKYGNVDTVTYPENLNGQRKQSYIVFDSIAHTYPVSVSDEQGYASSTKYDFRFGKPTLTTDISGNNMEYTYDSKGRTKTIRGPKEIVANKPYTIAFDYWDEIDNALVLWARTRHYDPLSDTTEIITVLFTDGLGRVLQTKKNSVVYDLSSDMYNDVMVVSGQNILDAFGRVESTTYPITEGMGQDIIFNDNVDGITPTMITYDVMDRKTSVTLPDQTTSTMSYDFDTDGSDILRFQTITTDANGIQTAVYTNPKDLKTTIITDFDNTNDTTRTVTRFVYDEVGELVRSIDPEGNVTDHSYDMLGRQTQRKHPDAGTTKWKYDNAGNLISMQTQNLINQNKKIIYFYYYNRLDSIQYPNNPENNIYYEYGVPNTGNESKRIIKQQDASGVQQFFYGNMGELTKNIRTFVIPKGETCTFEMNWSYDTWNRLQVILYPDGEKVDYFYDNGGQLRKMIGFKSSDNYKYINTLGYDKFGSRVFMEYGNGWQTQYTYNDTNRRLINLNSSNDNESLQDITYNYDAIGNIISVANGASAASNNLGGTYQYDYTYDNINRLTQSSGLFWNYEDLPCADYTLQMQYSPSGNILNKDQSVSANINGSYIDKSFSNATYKYTASQPHAVKDIIADIGFKGHLKYDANGNMIYFKNEIADINRYHCWDEENRLSAVKDENYLSCYTYDAGGERVLKLAGQVQQILVNNDQLVNFANLNDNKTLYTSPYMVVSNKEYSKHYYIEGQRICSKLGGGFKSSIIKIDSLVAPITSDYTAIRNSLAAMLKRSIECANFNPNYVSLIKNFEIIDWLKNVDNTETDQYFYHSDHLGSSSFITDINSTPTEHLQYLPFGDLFVQQRATSDYYTPYKFTGKEQDEETNYDYFGARYYTPEFFNIWLSVDPMADKYPNISPYHYCSWNPIKIIDPNGEDGFIVSEDGHFSRFNDVGGKNYDVIFSNNSTNKPNLDESKALRVEKGFVNTQSSSKASIYDNDTKQSKLVPYNSFNIKGDEKAKETYEFLSANTHVEWGVLSYGSEKGENGLNILATSHSHDNNAGIPGAFESLVVFQPFLDVKQISHSHRDGTDRPSPSDRKFIMGARALNPNNTQNTTYSIYKPETETYTFYNSSGKINPFTINKKQKY